MPVPKIRSTPHPHGNPPEGKLDTVIGCSVVKLGVKIIHRPMGAEVLGLKNTIAFTGLVGNGAVLALAY